MNWHKILKIKYVQDKGQKANSWAYVTTSLKAQEEKNAVFQRWTSLENGGKGGWEIRIPFY